MDKSGAVIIEELFPISVKIIGGSNNPSSSLRMLQPYSGALLNLIGCNFNDSEETSNGNCFRSCQKPTWHVYLTSQGIHIIHNITHYCCWNRSFPSLIPFTHIKDVQIYGSHAYTGYRYLGTKLASSTSIFVEIKPVEVPWIYSACCCTAVPSVTEIKTKEDATSFLQVLKQQMNSMAREYITQ